MNSNIERIILITVATFITSVLIMPLMKKIAFYIGALDIPKDNRRMHKKTMPKLGGLGMFLSFLLGYVLFGKQSIVMNSILIGSFIIILTGLIDDINPLKPKYKLIGQLLAASLIPLYGNLVLTEVSAFGLYIKFGFLAIPITIIFIVSIINCINLIDGLDGLSSGISSIYFLTIGIICIMTQSYNSLESLLSFIMLGSTLGYLWHNFPPAKIFMGDTGSMFLGYIISVIALLGFKNVTFTSVIVPVFLLAIPILDTLCAIIRRKLKGESIATPDKQHLHHQIMNMTSSVRKTIIIIYLVDILFAFASIIYVLKDNNLGIIIYTILFILTLWVLIKTSIIKDKNTKKN